MLRAKRNKILIITGLICVLVIGAIKGPLLFHAYYRIGIAEDEWQSRKAHYNHLSNLEVFDETLSDQARQTIHEERVQLYYWFRVRGSGIDGGHHGWVWPRQWNELIQYWNGAKSFGWR